MRGRNLGGGRRGMLVAVVAGLVIVAAVGVVPAAAAAAPPNVVVILADDLGFSDLGCYGGEIDTPNLDRLAAGGLRYTQASNTARCWPTRAALLTGYYAQAIRRDALPGGEGGAKGSRPAWARLLPELLEPAGYRSYHSGKWHIDGEPLAQGFDRALDVNATGQSNYFDPAGVRGAPVAEAPADFYVTTAIGDHAVACLAEHARDHAAHPFFHFVAFTAPHFPLQAPPDLIAKHRDRYRAGWDEIRAARIARVKELGIVTSPPAAVEPDVGPPYAFPEALEKLGPGEVTRPLPWGQLTPDQREFQATKMAIHAAMVEALDREVGRIVAQVEAMHALDDTLIVFLSDNGASAEIMVRGAGHDPAAPPGSRQTFLCLGPGWSSACNAPCRRHKTWVHEGGIATPWIVHWPRGCAARGELRPQPVHVIDVVPTVLELAGVGLPREHAGAAVPPLHGRSFAASLTNPAAPPAHDVLWWCHEGHRAVRVGDLKLVAVKRGPWELYDLAADRCETTDLAAARPEQVKSLEAAWERIAADCRGLAATTPAATTRGKAARRPPNIVYVMTDDQGYGDLAAHGNPVIRTPNLDRLWRESVRLTEFHASPTCAPTRAALLTGRHEFRSGVTHTIHERERLALSATTLPDLLRHSGYTTGIFGKWHLGDEDAYQPGRRGFDRTFIHGAGGIGQTFPGSCGDVAGNGYFDPVIRSDGAFVTTRGYCTDVFFDAALAWIRDAHAAERPFFCMITPNAPHTPLICPAGADEPYLAPLERAGVVDPKSRAEIAKFYGMIENVDTNVGRLLAEIDRLGLAEETLVVFTTDNGTATGAGVFNAGMRGAKGSVWRGGTRVPSFWRWPGVLPAGVDVPAVTAHLDVLPTLCEVAEAVIPADVAAALEGRSLLPLLHDAHAPWPDRPLVTHQGRWKRGQAAASQFRNCRVRAGRWSLVNVKNRSEGWELHDIATDPGETRDVAADHPDVVRRLADGYDRWWASVKGDLINEDLDGPAENPFQVAYRRQQQVPAAVDRPPARPPNIVFLLCDDLGTGDLSCLGSRDIQTPHIDALFARGTRLTRHWAGSAVCAPSRCVLLTGRHPGHAVIRSNREAKPEGQFPMPAGTVTLAGLLRDAGYATGAFGKWGLGGPGSTSEPLVCGFERFFGYNCQREAHTYYPQHLWSDRDRVAIDNPPVPRGGTIPAEPPPAEAAFAAYRGTTYAADLIAAEQRAFVTAHADRPFLLYVPTTVPHLALQVPADEPALVTSGTHFGDERPYLGGRGYVPCRQPLATYAAMIARMDREVGRIVALLEELNLTDDTIIVFSSDNGATMPGTGGLDTERLASNGPLHGWKGSPYEGGLRVPTVAVWPGRIPAGRTIDAPTGFEDWLPTLLDLAGLTERLPAGLDGRSLATSLLGQAAADDTRLLYRELTEGRGQAATDGRWKVIRRAAGPKRPAEPGPIELYDLEADPTEATNVADRHPAVVERLRACLDREHVPDPDWPLPFADAASAAAGADASRNRDDPPASAAAGRRPSVIVFLADDMRADAIHALGNPAIRTPVLDALVARGCSFDRAYCMGALQAAVCVPSRAMLLSGRSLFRVREQLGGCDTWPEAFERAGYRTFVTGKWHNGQESLARCFAEGSHVYCGGMHAHVGLPTVSFRGHGHPEPDAVTDRHSSEIIGAAAEAFVEGLGDEPFFAWCAFTAPHDPRQPQPEFRRRYDGQEPPPPANFLPAHPFDNGALAVRDERLLERPLTRERISAELADYHALIEGLDAQIGRVLAALERQGRLDDTLVLFAADQGLALGSHGLLGKQNLYEHSMRAPAVLVGPGVPRGRRIDALAYLFDLTATLGELAGVAAPDGSEGLSLAAVLRGDRRAVRESLLLAYKTVQRALVTPDWKLISYPRAGVTQVFDVANDPGEQRDRAADPAVAARRRDLESRLVAVRREAGDPAAERAASRPPNFVVVLIDDLGYGDIGPFGATKQKTPHLDRMAREGMKLTSFYAAPACSVSRAQLLTGCYGLRVSVPWVFFPAGQHGLNPAESTTAERLKALGYATACFGKWHLGDQPEFLPGRQGFDRSFGIPYSNDMQKPAAGTGTKVVPLLRDDRVIELLTDEMQRGIVERCTEEAVAFIREQKDRPFFLYVPHTAVHVPIFPGERFRGRSGNGRFGDWVEEVDWSVGRILDTLRDEGLDERTLVIFTSDNGPWTVKGRDGGSAGPLRGAKGSTWEGGVRVPTIARWPGHVPAGRESAAVAGTIDLLPTFVTLAGGTLPAEPAIDGCDISGLLLGTGVEPAREAHYFFHGASLQAVRSGRWKLAIAPQQEGMGQGKATLGASLEEPRLYDLEDDLGETTDVADDHPTVVARLRGLAERMREELCGDRAPGRRPPGTVEKPAFLYPVVPEPVAGGQPRRPD
jgi:arylsulfatase A-like enzyme